MTLADLLEDHRKLAEAATARAQNWQAAAKKASTPDMGVGGALRAERFRQVAELALAEASFHATAAQVVADVADPALLALNFRHRATRMHWRAQKAEGLAHRIGLQSGRLRLALDAITRNRATIKRSLKRSQQKRSELREELDRLQRARDPLYRFIALGRQFP